jgi:hypothetical protein
MNTKEANEAISKLVSQAHMAITAAEKIANDNDLTFSFDVSYGMGGNFHPKSEFKPGGEMEWAQDEYGIDAGDEQGGWVASSQTC